MKIVGNGLKKGSIETGKAIINAGKGAVKMTKKGLGNFGGGMFVGEVSGDVVDALTAEENEVEFIAGQDFYSPDDGTDENEEINAEFNDYTPPCDGNFESCNGNTETPEKVRTILIWYPFNPKS